MTNPINPRDPVHRRVLALELAVEAIGTVEALGARAVADRYTQLADLFVAYIEHGEQPSD